MAENQQTFILNCWSITGGVNTVCRVIDEKGITTFEIIGFKVLSQFKLHKNGLLKLKCKNVKSKRI